MSGWRWMLAMYRNRIDHDIDGAGLVAMSTGRVLPDQAERGLRQSPQRRRRRRRQRQTGPSPGRRFADSHLVLFAGRHLPAALRMGTLRQRSRPHQVKINLMNNSSRLFMRSKSEVDCTGWTNFSFFDILWMIKCARPFLLSYAHENVSWEYVPTLWQSFIWNANILSRFT